MPARGGGRGGFIFLIVFLFSSNTLVRIQPQFVENLIVGTLGDEVVAERVETVRDAVVQSGATLLILRVDVGAVPKERLDDARVAVLTRDDKRRVAELIATLRRTSVF